MTAATVPAPLSPLCPTCHHATRKHNAVGCTVNNGSCACAETRATLAGTLDELPAPTTAQAQAATLILGRADG